VQDWANLIREIALLFSVFVAGLTAWNALRKTSHEVSKDDKEELRADRDLYRNRWLESEKAFDEIDAENDKLRKKVKRLENTIDDFKEKEDKR
jgi:predicted RNase H-like nuclease (RuvC/YqgF family)